MKDCHRYTWCSVLALLLVCSPAMSQEQPDSKALDTLRTRTPSEMDLPVIDGWIKAQLQILATKAPDPLKGPEAATEFFKACTREYGNDKNSRAFKDQLSARMATLFQAEFAKGMELDPVAARAIARTLNDLASPSSREALLVGLASPDDVVRYLCAKSLASIRDAISGDEKTALETIAAVVKAEEKEKSGIVAMAAYQAVAYTNHPNDAMDGVLKILDGRLEVMRTPGTVLDRAELAAIKFLDTVPLAGDTAKAEIVRRLAVLLRIHVQRFDASDCLHDEKTAIMETIFDAETLIEKLVRPSGKAPNVREKMQEGGAAAPVNMEIELNSWIGTGQTEGLLNAGPWNVPQGAP